MRNFVVMVNKRRVPVTEEGEFIYNDLMDIYQKQAFDAGLEWEDWYEDFIFTLSRDIEMEVDRYRANLITNEPLNAAPWDDED